LPLQEFQAVGFTGFMINTRFGITTVNGTKMIIHHPLFLSPTPRLQINHLIPERKATMTPCPKSIAWKSHKYLAHVRTRPCCVCGYPDVQAHHIRFSHIAGIGMKPPDTWAIPLCHQHHREWHDMGITSFQKKYEVDIYRELFEISKSWIENHAK